MPSQGNEFAENATIGLVKGGVHVFSKKKVLFVFKISGSYNRRKINFTNWRQFFYASDLVLMINYVITWSK